MTKRTSFTQADVRRAIEAVRSLGLPCAGVKVNTQTGEITVLTTPGLAANDVNPLDRVLDR